MLMRSFFNLDLKEDREGEDFNSLERRFHSKGPCDLEVLLARTELVVVTKDKFLCLVLY